MHLTNIITVVFPTIPEGDMEKSPLLSNGYNPPPKGLMAQYMALNGGMPHPALLAHTGLPLPPHPAPWAAHTADHPFKNGPHPDNLARWVSLLPVALCLVLLELDNWFKFTLSISVHTWKIFINLVLNCRSVAFTHCALITLISNYYFSNIIMVALSSLPAISYFFPCWKYLSQPPQSPSQTSPTTPSATWWSSFH